jgi:lipopolysaccharide biosynthesis glycosyltransferase
MQHISELFKNDKFQEKPWLIIGKGPSFGKIKEIDLNKFYTFGLNHVITKVGPLDITHLIDFNVFESCQEEIYRKASYLCMPINPHFNNKATEVTIKDLVKKNDVLKKISEEGRLFWYNHLKKDRFLSDNNRERLNYENVEVKYFSAEVPFYLLGMNKIKELYSVGIDGGSSYDNNFTTETLLANGRPSFDIQFDEIINTIEKFDLVYSPIDAQYPVKVYVGSQEEQMLSVKVLEYSIKKRTTASVDVFPMHQSKIKYSVPKDPSNRQRTPFSFQRFTIPQLNNFEGRAIYVDSDMQVLKDIRQLWNLPMASNDVFTVKKKDDTDRILQFSVMLLDCNKLKWSVDNIVEMLDNGELSYHSLMREMRVAKNIGVKIPHTWNCLEWYKEGESALVHYTDMDTQPWVSVKNPLCKIWMEDLIEAIEVGFINIEMVKDHVKKSWVRPSLLYQIEHKIFDSLKLPKEALNLDKDFIAPYKKLEHIKKREEVVSNCAPKNKDLLDEIFKSVSYKYFLRFIPAINKKLKRLRRANPTEMKSLLRKTLRSGSGKYFIKFAPSVKRKLKEMDKRL